MHINDGINRGVSELHYLSSQVTRGFLYVTLKLNRYIGRRSIYVILTPLLVAGEDFSGLLGALASDCLT